MKHESVTAMPAIIAPPPKTVQNECSGHQKNIRPSNDIESTLKKLWAESLGMDDLSVESDFFALGGHALLALNLIDKINRTLDWNPFNYF